MNILLSYHYKERILIRAAHLYRYLPEGNNFSKSSLLELYVFYYQQFDPPPEQACVLGL